MICKKSYIINIIKFYWHAYYGLIIYDFWPPRSHWCSFLVFLVKSFRLSCLLSPLDCTALMCYSNFLSSGAL
jgi:hypothetical protein